MLKQKGLTPYLGNKIKILLADDHAVLRAGLKLLLNSEPDMEVIGEAADGREAVRASRQINPDIVLMDINMPRLNGVEATREICRLNPEIKILALTMYEDDGYIHQMLKAGAVSYVSKKAADIELINAIRSTYHGEQVIYSAKTSRVVVEPHREKDAVTLGNQDVKLNQRDIELLRFIARGFTNQAIADRIHLSLKAIENNKARLKEKLGMSSRSELVYYAIQIGLLED